jgi:hypothetical protein
LIDGGAHEERVAEFKISCATNCKRADIFTTRPTSNSISNLQLAFFSLHSLSFSFFFIKFIDVRNLCSNIIGKMELPFALDEGKENYLIYRKEIALRAGEKESEIDRRSDKED